MVSARTLVGEGYTYWQAPAVGDPSFCLPVESLRMFCGPIAEPIQQPLLCPDALAQRVGRQKDRQGSLPGWVCLCACKWLLGAAGLYVNGLLSGTV